MKAKTKKFPTPKQYFGDQETILCLRTCNADLQSRQGFQWPFYGPIEAPDWNPAPCCGQGLHVLVGGSGDGSHLSWNASAKWLAVEVAAKEIVDLGGKGKVPRAYVVAVGDRLAITNFVGSRHPAIACVGGTATAGDCGTATAGYGGTAIAGYRGTANAGDRGTATAGYEGTATAGDGGTVCIRYWDGSRHRLAVGYVGNDGILPNVKYRIEGGKLVEVGLEA